LIIGKPAQMIAYCCDIQEKIKNCNKNKLLGA